MSIESDLIAEQVSHALDLMKADMAAVKATADHDRQLASIRLKQLENQIADHEIRIRSTTDGVTQFKFFAGIGGGAGILGLISAFKGLIGG